MNEWNDNRMGIDWATSVLKSDALKMNRIAPASLTHNYHYCMGPRSALPLLIIFQPTEAALFVSSQSLIGSVWKFLPYRVV